MNNALKLVLVTGFCLPAVFLAGLLVSGCLTLDSSTKQDEVAEMRSSVSEEIIKVKQEVSSLKGQLEELQYKIDKMSQTQSQQSKELNTTLKEWRKETQSDVEKKISGIENKLLIIEKKQAQLQERTNIIVEETTKENKELRGQIEAIRKSSSYTTSEGYYVVSSGDTLSKIAQMFGISMKTIMEANNITDPNSIHTGQKLIIPEKK